MKTTFDLPDPLVRQAKALAARQGRPLRDFVAEAIDEKLLQTTSEIADTPAMSAERREARPHRAHEHAFCRALTDDKTRDENFGARADLSATGEVHDLRRGGGLRPHCGRQEREGERHQSNDLTSGQTE